MCHFCAAALLLTRSRSWSQNFDKETDWNVVSEPGATVNNRQVKLSRGKFLGGCSGCNGTLCVRGARQDFDDWGLEGWSGEEFWKYMNKVKLSSLLPIVTLQKQITHPHSLNHPRGNSPACFNFAFY